MPGRFLGVEREIAGTPNGGGGEVWRAPSLKVPRRQAHAEEVFVYVCVCVRVERCARRNGNYMQPLLMGTNSRALAVGFVHNKNETSSLTHTHARGKTRRGIHNLRHPAPPSEKPHAIGETSLTEPPQHTSKSQSGPKVAPASPQKIKFRKAGRRADSRRGSTAHSPAQGQSCVRPRRCQPAHSGSHTRAAENAPS